MKSPRFSSLIERRFVRFCIVGVLSTALHYGLYCLLLWSTVEVNVSYTAAYIASFFANFYLTSVFTFRARPAWGKFAGFAGSHAVNYVLHIVLLNVFLWLGVPPYLAPIPVILTAMLAQYTILRFVFTHKTSQV